MLSKTKELPMIYTVTFNPSLDYVIKLKSIKSDDINRADSERICYGGKGINVSAMLKTLGCEAEALGFAGGFTGKELIKLLDKDGIRNDFSFLENGNTRINVKLRTGEELDINANGPEISEKDFRSFEEKLISHLKDGDTLVLAGALPPSLPLDTYGRLVKLAEGKNIRCVVDASGEALIKAIKEKPFLIKPNHHEAGEIFGRQLKSDDEFIEHARLLQKLGARNVLISRAEEGSVLVCENEEIYKAESVNGKLVNSVGCGDSMVAGFIAGYEKTGDFAQALKLASACGSATAFTDGLANKSQIERVLEKTHIKNIKE